MSVYIRDYPMTLTVREDVDLPDGVAAILSGIAVPYNTPTEIGPGLREQFAPGSFDVNDVIGKPMAWRHGEPIGVIREAHNEDHGLVIDRADIADTVVGRDATTLTKLGGMGLSVGFQPVSNAKTPGLITRMKAALHELSLTHLPAYATAGVSSIREEETMPETTEVETAVVPAPDTREFVTRDALAAVERQIDALAHIAPVNTNPLAQYRTVGEYHHAVLAGTAEVRALVDQVTGDNPGLMTPNWQTNVRGIIDRGRPSITALGTESPGTSGMDINWPYFDGDLAAIVEEQLTEKAEVNSVKISFKKGSASLRTWAAASDISFQLLQRSNPSYLEAHNRVMLASYSAVTANVFADALVAGGTASAVDYDLAADTTGALFRAAVFAASLEVDAATGAPASVVLVAPNVFTKAGGWSDLTPQPYGTMNVGGTATASTLNVSVSGLRVVLDRNLAAGTIIVTNDLAAKWVEDGPRLIDAVNVAQLGQDVAVYGFGVPVLYIAAGVVKITNLA
jgi:HK97 family phage prohead protease